MDAENVGELMRYALDECCQIRGYDCMGTEAVEYERVFQIADLLAFLAR